MNFKVFWTISVQEHFVNAMNVKVDVMKLQCYLISIFDSKFNVLCKSESNPEIDFVISMNFTHFNVAKNLRSNNDGEIMKNKFTILRFTVF